MWLLAFLVALPADLCPEQQVTVGISLDHDLRVQRLRTFFRARECPIEELSVDFIAAADYYDLDWRLLPSISFIESSGGKRFLNNNIFGWDSCRIAFPSVRDGIYHVASRLATSKLYKDKDLQGILQTYNPYATYPGRIIRIMETLGPADPNQTVTVNYANSAPAAYSIIWIAK